MTERERWERIMAEARNAEAETTTKGLVQGILGQVHPRSEAAPKELPPGWWAGVQAAMQEDEVEREVRRLKAGLLGQRPMSTTEGGAWLNSLLASPMGDELARWSASTFNHNHSAYDTAIDAAYNASHVGGSALHHLVDGHHSLAGAFEAAASVSNNDSVLQEMSAAVEHLLRDMMSVSGINPLVQLEPATLGGLQDALAGSLGLSRSWTADALTINAPEALGGLVGTMAMIFGWSNWDASRFARLTGSLGVSALWSANPLLGLVAMVAAGRAFHIQRSRGTVQTAAAMSIGALTSSLVIAAITILPLWLAIGLLVGLVLVRFGQPLRRLVAGWIQFHAALPTPAFKG